MGTVRSRAGAEVVDRSRSDLGQVPHLGLLGVVARRRLVSLIIEDLRDAEDATAR